MMISQYLTIRQCFLALALLCVCTFGALPLSAQFLPRDSLLRELHLRRNSNAVRDSDYVRLLFLVARSYRPNTVQMRPFVEEARSLVPALKSPRMKALLYLNIGNIYRLERRFKEARDTLENALQLFAEAKDSSNMSSTSGLIAVMYQQRDMFATALDYYMRELEIADKCGDLKNSFLARINLSEISIAMQQPEKALVFARQAESVLYKNKSTAFFAEWCKSMSAAHRELRSGDSALFYAQRGVQAAWQLRDSLLLVNLMAQEIRSMRQLKKHKEALQCLDSLVFVEKSAMQGGLIRPLVHALAAETLLAFAQDSEPQSKNRQMLLKSALEFAQKGLAHSSVSKKEQADLYASLSEIYRGLGMIEAGFDAQRKLLVLRDSVFSASLQASIADMHERYALGQKEAEIAIMQANERRASMLNALLTTIALGGLLVAGVYVQRYRVKKRSEAALHDANSRLQSLYDETVVYKNRIEEQNAALLTQEHDLRAALEQNRFLTIVARHAAQIIIISDNNGLTKFVNQEFEKVTGYAADEIIGKKPGSLLQGKQTDKATVREIGECVRAGKPFNGDILNYTKSGHAYWVRLVLTPIFNSEGECEHFVAIQYDITDERLKQLEERIQAQLTMQSMMDSSRDIAMLVGADFRMLQFNKTAERAMCAMKPEIEPHVGMDMRYYSPLPIAEVERDFAEVLQGKPVAFDRDMPNPSTPKDILTFEVNYNPVRSPDGQVVAISFVARNITHRKQLQEQMERTNAWLEERVRERTQEIERRALELSSANNKLAAAFADLEMAQLDLWSTNHQLEDVNKRLADTNDRLEAASREKSEILGIVAHDLRSPLSGIQGLAGVMREGADPEFIPQIANEIYNASERMFTLLSNLLSVNAIESGKMEMNLTPLNVSFIVQTIIDRYADRAAEKNIRLQGEVSSEPCFAIADEFVLPQVVENLVSNAVKYSPHGKNVYVRVRHWSLVAGHLTDDNGGIAPVMTSNQAANNQVTNNQRLRIEVQDEGPGISPDDMTKLFGKFARLSAQPTGGEHSTGLGLNIVKQMVEAMQGRVWCESKFGNGATFIVELPYSA
ncbi:MAG: PAS domain S-box protein [Candidatus Kapabacteria bacterium]|nr:PAS domain S-box protein [Candidatus Kapabacteria bacterium]